MRTSMKDLYALNLPYSHDRIALMLRKVGLHWRHASDAEVRATVAAHAERARAANRNRPPRKSRKITVDGVTLTAAEWAKRVGVATTTLLRRMSKMGDIPAITRSLANPGVWRPWQPYAPHKGRIVAGDRRATLTQWAAELGIARQSIWATASKRGITIQQEVARRLDEAARKASKEVAA